MSLLDVLSSHLDDNALQQISSRLGTDQNTTSTAIAAAVPVLVGALAKNAATGDGAQKLRDALARDHDGSALDNLPATLGPDKAAEGNAILGHVLGDRQAMAEQAIAKATGLDASKVGPLLATLAPVVMGALGRVARDRGLDAGGLTAVLEGEKSALGSQAPGVMGIVTRLLDRNQDGSVLDDVGGMIGKVFGRK
jgi:hypothetical protein